MPQVNQFLQTVAKPNEKLADQKHLLLFSRPSAIQIGLATRLYQEPKGL